MAQVVYLRISAVNHDWLRTQSDNSKISITRIVDDMVTEMRENGYTVSPQRLQAKFTKEDKDARD
jgi:hypothetical protein